MWRFFQKFDWPVALASVCSIVVLMLLVRLTVRFAIKRISHEGAGSLTALAIAIILGGLLGIPSWALAMWVAGFHPSFTELLSTGATLGAMFGLVSVLRMDSFPPKWKYSGWVLHFLVVLCLVGYFVAWPWYRDSQMSTTADQLMKEMSEHGGQVERQAGSLPDVSNKIKQADLLTHITEITKKLQDSLDRSSELIRREEEIIKKVPEEKRQQLQQADKQYAAQVRQANEKYKQQVDQLRKKMRELSVVEPPKNFTNSSGMKFAWIPPGNFIMGSPKEEEGANNETQHKVTLTKGFYMGVYAVTQEQWHAVMGKNPSHFKGEKNLPVETVSWDDCQEFIKKLRETDKKLYRLPTEAEWEYACRARTKTPFHFGDTLSTDQANYDGTAVYGNGKKGVSRKKTTPVGSFPPNAFGLFDMHGNVFQLCQDKRFGENDYPPKDVVDPQGSENGGGRIMRGGSFATIPLDCRSGGRSNTLPDARSNNVGFRLCFFVE